MTLAEFKAWFEGFTEGMEAAPIAKQWKRIKERVTQIDGSSITREVIYRDRYWHYPSSTMLLSGTSICMGQADTISNAATMNVSSNMVDLGRAEYSQVFSS